MLTDDLRVTRIAGNEFAIRHRPAHVKRAWSPHRNARDRPTIQILESLHDQPGVAGSGPWRLQQGVVRRLLVGSRPRDIAGLQLGQTEVRQGHGYSGIVGAKLPAHHCRRLGVLGPGSLEVA